MSQWKFGKFETEIDFTDIDFLGRIDEGKQLMQEAEQNVLKVGKNSDIIRSHCEVFYSLIMFSDVMQEKLCLKERQVLCYV